MPDPALEERRRVAIVFAQASGLADLPDSERAAAADALFLRVRDIVARQDGTVDKFVGDVAMVLFGAPVAHEDDALRAVKCALGIAAEVDAFAAERGITLLARAGVNEGEVLWGRVGGDRATAMGDPVNVAQRLMAAAEPGTILASAAVRQLTQRVMRFGTPRVLHVKGRAEDVEASVVLGVRAGATELRLVADLSAPFMGRQEEMGRMLGADARFVYVTGEAGIGKSRLLAEFRRRLRVARPSDRVLVGRAMDGVRLPLGAFGEIVRSETGAGAFEAEGGERVVDALTREMGGGVEAENRAQLVALSLGYALPEARVRHIDPARMQAETDAAWVAWLRALASARPVVLCLEDLHWADEGTLRLMEALARDLGDARVAVCASSRPGGAAPAGFARVALGDLGSAPAIALAQAVFRAPISAALGNFLFEHSGGNPLYIEELARFLRDERLVAGAPLELAVPSSRIPGGLQGLLVARLDALPANEKEILKGASVIGRFFWPRFLALVLERDVAAEVEAGCRRELVSLQDRSLLADDEQFMFRHGLLHDAAYSLLLKKERQRLHARAALLLEARPAGGGRRLRVLAARHHEGAGDVARAGTMLLAASREAMGDCAYPEALDHAREAERLGIGGPAALAAAHALTVLARYDEALAAARRVAGDVNDRTRALTVVARILVARGELREAEMAAREAVACCATGPALTSAQVFVADALRALGRLAEAADVAGAALPPARAHAASGDREAIRALAQLLSVRGLVMMDRGSYPEAMEMFHEQLALARGLGDRAAIAGALAQVSAIHQHRGDYAESLALREEVLATRREIGDRAGVAAILSGIGNINYARGDFAAATRSHQEALVIRRDIGDFGGVARALSDVGNVAHRTGDLPEALRLHHESLDLRRRLGDRPGVAGVLGNIGLVLGRQGHLDAAMAAHEESLAMRREIGDPYGIALTIINLGYLHQSLGDFARALPLFVESLSIRRGLGDRQGIAGSLLAIGNISVYTGDLENARVSFEESRSIRHEIGDEVGVALCDVNLGWAASIAGNHEAGCPLLDAGVAIFRSRGANTYLADALTIAALAHGAAGHASVAFGLLAEALALPGIPKPLEAEIHLAAALLAFEPEDAAEKAEASLLIAGELGRQHCEPSARAVLALSLARRGSPADAAAELALARATLPLRGLRFPDNLEFAFMEAEILHRCGDGDGARRAAGNAVALARKHGAGGILRRKSALCRELGVTLIH